MEQLGLKSKINLNGKRTTVSNIIEEDKHQIFELIKQGYDFNDEVLAICRIRKTIRDRQVYSRVGGIAEDKRHYEKDNESVSRVVKSLQTIDQQYKQEFLDATKKQMFDD